MAEEAADVGGELDPGREPLDHRVRVLSYGTE
jgi:hypothetical protein